MTAAQCRWKGCDRPPRARGVCSRHHGRTMSAGRRAARGPDPVSVAQAIAQAARADTPPATVPERIEDLEWLLDAGEWPGIAARRCGWNRDTAMTIARRHGRDDLAERLQIEAVPT